MTNRWSKEDRAAWDNSEVAGELEKKVLNVISSLDAILKSSAISDLADIPDANEVGRVTQELGKLDDVVDRLTNGADDDSSLKAHGEKLLAFYNEHTDEAGDLKYNDLMYYNEESDNPDVPESGAATYGNVMWYIMDSHNAISSSIKTLGRSADQMTVEGRLKILVKAVDSIAEEITRKALPCHDVFGLSRAKKECEGVFISEEDSEQKLNAHKNQVLANIQDSINHISALENTTPVGHEPPTEELRPASETLDAPPSSTSGEQSSDANDALSVVARLRGLLKDATDKRDIKLGYKIERTIDEILEGE